MSDRPDRTPKPEPHGTIEEPGQATVDDWFGQNAARDADLADELVDEEEGDEAAAERRFEREADGEAKFKAGHDRPDQ